MSIAERLVTARRQEEESTVERKLLEVRRRREENVRQAKRTARAAESATISASTSGKRDQHVVASVRATIVQSGRVPWWEEPEATVETHAALAGKDQRQNALHAGDRSGLSDAIRSLATQRPAQLRGAPSVGQSVMVQPKPDGAGSGLSSSALHAANRLNRGLPARALPISTAARTGGRPRQAIAAGDVAQILQAQLQHKRDRALSEVTLRAPGS